MSTSPPFRRRATRPPLNEQLARVAEALRLNRNGGFVLLSYDEPGQLDDWLSIIESYLGDITFLQLTPPNDGAGLLLEIALASQSPKLSKHDIGVLVVSGLESLAPAAAERLIENLNLMRTRLAKTAYPILFGASGYIVDLLLRTAPDLTDRVGIWCDLRGYALPTTAFSTTALPPPALTTEERYRERVIQSLRFVQFSGVLSINKTASLPLTAFYVPLRGGEMVEPQRLLLFRKELYKFRKMLEAFKDLPPSSNSSDPIANIPIAPTEGVDYKRKDIAPEQIGSMYEALEPPEPNTPREVNLSETVARHNAFVVLGDPGAGKSTFLRALALAAVEGSPERMGLPKHEDGWLPLLISCASYATALEDGNQDFVGAALSHVAEQFHILNIVDEPGYALARGRVLFLFDGLDEIAESSQRDNVARAIDSIIGDVVPNGNRVVISSRVAGYQAHFLTNVEATVTIYDFDELQVALFLRRWYVALEQFTRGDLPEVATDAERVANQLAQVLRTNTDVSRLAGNPLLLTIIALTYLQDMQLPRHRVNLYDTAVYRLVERWNQSRSLSSSVLTTLPDARLVISLLSDIGLWMQEHSLGAIQDQQLFSLLIEAYEKRGLLQPQIASAAFLRDLQAYGGLFVKQAHGFYSFLHRSFQEYFAARALASMDTAARWQRIEPHLKEPGWREVILLTAGELGVRISNESEVTNLVRRVRGKVELPPGCEQSRIGKLGGTMLLRMLPILNDQQLDELEERMLQRRLLLAGSMLADDIGVARSVAEEIVRSLLVLFDCGPAYLRSDVSICIERLPQQLRDHVAQSLIGDLTKTRSASKRATLISFIGKLSSTATQPITAILLTALSDSSSAVRLNAIAAFNRLDLRGNNEVIAGLLMVLEDPERRIRRTALRTLGNLSTHATSAVVDKLLSSSSDPDSKVSRDARNALGQIAEHAAPVIIDALLTALDNPNPDVRYNAMSALSRLNPEIAANIIPALLNSFADDQPEVRRLIAFTLGRLGQYVTSSVVQTLFAALKDTDVKVCISAVNALISLYPYIGSLAVDGALTALAHQNPNVRANTVLFLGNFKPETPSAIINALITSLADPDPKVRYNVAMTLGNLDKQATGAVVDALLAALADREVKVRSRVITALGMLSSYATPAVVNGLLTAMADSEVEVRERAIQSLGVLHELATPFVVDALAIALSSSETKIRERAAWALGHLQAQATPAVASSLLRALADPEEIVRRGAAVALAKLAVRKDLNIVDDLIVALAHSKPLVRTSATGALAELDSSYEQTVTAALLNALKDPEPAVREGAAAALARLSTEANPTLIDGLCSALQDPDVNVRQLAAITLGRIGPSASPTAVDALLTALADPDKGVQYRAEETLRLLGHRSRRLRVAQLRLLEELQSDAYSIYKSLLGEEEGMAVNPSTDSLQG